MSDLKQQQPEVPTLSFFAEEFLKLLRAVTCADCDEGPTPLEQRPKD
jgi:hypothetical protein